MKFTVNRSDLHVALTQATRVVERRSTVAVVQNVRLEAQGDELRVTATDFEIEVKIRVPATVETPGGTTLPANLLATLVARMKEGVVTIEDLGVGQASVGMGRTRAKMQCLPASDFPDLGAWASPPVAVFQMAPSRLVEAIDATEKFVSTEETRYYLNGIYLHASAGASGESTISLVATNGHRLSRWRGPLPDGAAATPGVIIPRKAAAEIRKIASEAAKGEDQAVVSVSDVKIRLEIGRTTLTSKLIDGTFPDYQRITPNEWASVAIVDRGDAAAAIERVTCVLAERGRGIAFAFAETGRLTITARNPDRGDIEEEVAFFQGDDRSSSITIGFNAQYFRDALDAIPSETVAIRLPEFAGSPTLLAPASGSGDTDILIVLMPMQVK